MENPIRKIWYDENSMPPKNLVWFKGGKYYEYKNGKWIESTEFGKTSSSNTHEEQMSTKLGETPNQEFVAYLVDLLQNHLISSDNGNLTFSTPIPYGTLVNVNNDMSGENQSVCAYFVPIRYQGGKLAVVGYKKVTNERYSYDGTNTIESYTVSNIDSGFSFTIQSDYTVNTFSPI